MTQISSSSGKGSGQQKVSSVKAVSDDQSILSIIDKSLRHLNQISEANFIAQDLYIQLLKQKKTMKFDQIKKIYFTLTQGKAKQILFEHDKKELIQTDYNNHQGLIRLCWRSIQKLIKKITYYMINENHLSVISKNVLRLIHLNQKFVRRFQKLKNSSMLFIVEIMEKLIQENSILQKNIYDILLNRGYVVSLDEFYKLNGYDAEHREAYYAKKQQEVVTSESEDQQQDKQKNSTTKHEAKNSRNQTIRKKKGLRMDCRYSWREKIDLQEKIQKEKYPANKTNFQIRQSFQKFIGDFLQNQSLNEILVNYKFQEDEVMNKKQKQPHRLSEASLMQKKIFQSKIETVINQLKTTNSVKVSSKLLEIINTSSDLVINSKIGFAQKRFVQRKNSEGRDSEIAQRKFRQSHLINDRKIINQSFFRELLKRNTNIQNYVNQEILKDTSKIQHELENMTYQSPKANANVIQFSKKGHNQNNSMTKIKKSKFSGQKVSEMMLNPRVKTKEDIPSLKSIKSTFRFLQTELNCKYSVESRKHIPELRQVQSVTQKIRIARQEWQLRNERTILQAIENSTIDPSNLMKLTEMLQVLNNKKDLKIQPFTQKLKNLQEQGHRGHYFIGEKGIRLMSMGNEQVLELKINNITSQGIGKDMKDLHNRNMGSTFSKMKRIKTEQSPRQIEISKKLAIKFIEGFKENTRPYEIYDRRLRRILRR